ncbi:hypothetical protein ACFPMF_21895 [Larkinella bovis]|uniref:Uncharacterized protein n=1 Tax=Larkinella bovis TaxID=683041 RepID=A0ABW0IHN8_9BACT
MKTALNTFWLMILASPAIAQGMADYYRPTGETAEERSPEGRSAHSRRTELTQLLARYGEAYIRDRWYLSLDGFFRSDQGQLDETFDGLISTKATTKTGWSALVGWVSNERWAFEGGLARSPIHNTLVVGSGINALDLRFGNNKTGLVARGKYLMRFGRRTGNAGFWLGAGAWLVPNNGKQVSSFLVEGYSYRGSGGGLGRRTSQILIDTLQIFGVTRQSSHLSGMAEATAEYTIKLGGHADLSLFARKYWGIGPSLTTNLLYTVNSGASQPAVLRSDGSGWSVGLSVRYAYALRYDLRKMPGIFNLRGNRPEPATGKRRNGL